MPLFSKLAGLLRAPVGNNLDNNPKDVENLKRNFAREGRYKKSVENGYIDKELDEAIWSFQKDYDLKRDGRVNPGGETETTLVGTLYGDKLPRPTSRSSDKNPDVQSVSAAAIPSLIFRLLPLMGGSITAMQAWDKWKSQSTDGREQALKKLEGQENKKRNCDKMYETEINGCEKSYLKLGDAAYRACKDSAMTRYSMCLAGKSGQQWPPLQR